MTMIATDPAGKVHTYKGKRAVEFVAFAETEDGTGYYAHFAKTLAAAKNHWPSHARVHLARAIKS